MIATKVLPMVREQGILGGIPERNLKLLEVRFPLVGRATRWIQEHKDCTVGQVVKACRLMAMTMIKKSETPLEYDDDARAVAAETEQLKELYGRLQR